MRERVEIVAHECRQVRAAPPAVFLGAFDDVGIEVKVLGRLGHGSALLCAEDIMEYAQNVEAVQDPRRILLPFAASLSSAGATIFSDPVSYLNS